MFSRACDSVIGLANSNDFIGHQSKTVPLKMLNIFLGGSVTTTKSERALFIKPTNNR